MKRRNENLINARMRAGKTQVQAAKEAGMLVQAYQRYEYGGCNKKAIQTAIRIAQTLGIKTFQEFCTLWG